MLSAYFWRKYFGVYDVLNLAASYRDVLEKIAEEAEIKEGNLVLDAGAGTGNLALLLEKRGAKVTALDFSKEALDIYKNKNPQARVVLANLIEPLPFEDNFFDKIVSNNALYNIPRENRLAALLELKRVLKPGGKIILSNIHKDFKPIKIYVKSISANIKKIGLVRTLKLFVKMCAPTLKIFYYNFFIQREYKFSKNNLFDFEEQKELLGKAGFVDVSGTEFVYAGQGVLNSARKI